MATIIVDGKNCEASAEKNLLAALLDLGFNVPYFCWHPALGSVGACRLCAVKIFRDENDKTGKIVMSCMTPVTEGLRLAVEDQEVMEFRRRVIEWLMLNHPHDCPVCDEGGECHLQDMTVMTGQVYRRYRGRKRTYRNQNLGPFVNHEMNRCIQCYRCVRFYRDFAGGRDFEAFASKNQIYFGRQQEGALESEFSGNLIEICPTGVFTDKTLKKHYTRKWDLETAPSICVHCGLGCNIIPGARYGYLRRIYARFNAEVNGYFLCDRGRFGYEFVNDPQRLRAPLAGKEEPRRLTWEEALAGAGEAFKQCRRVAGVGSPRASLEANFALKKLVGDDVFSPGLSEIEHENLTAAIGLLQKGPARSASLAEVETADAILVLGVDPTNEAPMLDYAIRQALHQAALLIAKALGIPEWNDYAVRDAAYGVKGALFIATVASVKLESEARGAWRLSPVDLVRLAGEVDKSLQGQNADDESPAGIIAKALSGAKQPLVVVGVHNQALLQAAGNIAARLSTKREKPCLISLVAPECNSMGAVLLGGRKLDELLNEIETGQVDGLVVMENDLFRRAPEKRIESALKKLRCLVAMDHIPTRTLAAADFALPAASFAESMGTLINNEGRAQRFYQVFIAQGEPRASWEIARDLMNARQPGAADWKTCEGITQAIAQENAELAGIVEAAPPSSWRDSTGEKIAREAHRGSGRTAKEADQSVFESQPPFDYNSPFNFSMEGYQGEPPAALVPRFWFPGWNSVQSINKFQIEVGGALRGGPAGKRLLEPAGDAGNLGQIEQTEQLGEGEIWLMAQPVIYGSEELSRLAPGVASRTEAACVRMNPEEAAARDLAEGDAVRLVVGEDEFWLPVRLEAGVSPGVVVVPSGYPETLGLAGWRRASMEKAK